ncbi:hypothetical protein BDV33DRAFT_179161 [Aspergillus novoparasiticus]|uniref:Uncharacterized protein n=1 Tax=Aspergillus novoparasiticus TaxID=986946 RepID=A0A5N6EF95_9EURO|nr:hypothetical protein BDV33DRAFT_179161 [Aspergillus novoparasiticus]
MGTTYLSSPRYPGIGFFLPLSLKLHCFSRLFVFLLVSYQLRTLPSLLFCYAWVSQPHQSITWSGPNPWTSPEGSQDTSPRETWLVAGIPLELFLCTTTRQHRNMDKR